MRARRGDLGKRRCFLWALDFMSKAVGNGFAPGDAAIDALERVEDLAERGGFGIGRAAVRRICMERTRWERELVRAWEARAALSSSPCGPLLLCIMDVREPGGVRHEAQCLLAGHSAGHNPKPGQ